MASYKIRTAGNCPAVLFTIRSPFNIRIGRERSLPPRLLQAEQFSIAAKKISIRRGSLLSLRLLQAEAFLFAATKIRFGRGPRCYNTSDFLQRFPSSGLKSRIDAGCSPFLSTRSCIDAGSTVATKAGADAPGGGISLCFCRRGCAAPAQKSPRSTPHRNATNRNHAITRNNPINRNHAIVRNETERLGKETLCKRRAELPELPLVRDD